MFDLLVAGWVGGLGSGFVCISVSGVCYCLWSVVWDIGLGYEFGWACIAGLGCGFAIRDNV